MNLIQDRLHRIDLALMNAHSINVLIRQRLQLCNHVGQKCDTLTQLER